MSIVTSATTAAVMEDQRNSVREQWFPQVQRPPEQNGVVMTIHSKARRHREFSLGAPVRSTLMAATLVLGLAALGVGLHQTNAQSTAGLATVDIEENEPIFYNPNLVTIPAGMPIKFTVTNRGTIRHNFSITDHRNPGLTNLNVSFDNDPGQSGTATVNAPAGTYYFFCDEPGHEQAGMFGYVTVEQDAGITTSEATITPPAG
jgi:uncharacterized cupredoxin-like copper-binding protein